MKFAIVIGIGLMLYAVVTAPNHLAFAMGVTLAGAGLLYWFDELKLSQVPDEDPVVEEARVHRVYDWFKPRTEA